MNSLKFKDLCEQLKAAGAKNPSSWANSELQEDIPQFARFLILKGLTNIYQDIQGNITEIDNGSEDVLNTEHLLSSLIHEERLQTLLYSYGKSIIGRVIDLLDEGYLNEVNDQVGWALIELNQQGSTTDRLLQGLHEDFLEFEELELRKVTKTPS